MDCAKSNQSEGCSRKRTKQWTEQAQCKQEAGGAHPSQSPERRGRCCSRAKGKHFNQDTKLVAGAICQHFMVDLKRSHKQSDHAAQQPCKCRGEAAHWKSGFRMTFCTTNTAKSQIHMRSSCPVGQHTPHPILMREGISSHYQTREVRSLRQAHLWECARRYLARTPDEATSLAGI